MSIRQARRRSGEDRDCRLWRSEWGPLVRPTRYFSREAARRRQRSLTVTNRNPHFWQNRPEVGHPSSVTRTALCGPCHLAPTALLGMLFSSGFEALVYGLGVFRCDRYFLILL